ncbi:MAG TPA: acyl-CoA dehydrogenase, partial [Solimonas sp.]|nr:acyl-CoA dehydrogenase [Solimonas sp.]
MNLSLSDDQLLIRDAAENFLADVSDPAAVRRHMASEHGFDEAIWQRLAGELGWCAMPVAETHGGLGLGPVEMAVLLESMGRRLFCAPYFSTVCMAATLIAATAGDDTMAAPLAAIAEGRMRFGVAMPDGDWRDAAADLRAERVGDDWMLDGVAPQVVDGASADTLLLIAQTGDGGIGVFAVPRASDGVAVTALPTWDATRRFARVTATRAAAERIDDPQRTDGYARALALARLYLAAESLGGAQRCLDLTVEYVAQRKQFGRTIASFQAVKHRCAEMMVKVEALRSLVAGAAALAAGDAGVDELACECAAARQLAADTYFGCAQEAVQLHGGVGFTWEYEPQLYFKRAQAASHWFGSADRVREQIAASLLNGAPRSSSAGERNDTPDEAFRAQVAAWMAEHLQGRFAELRHRGGPGDEEAFPGLRKEWERELAAGGWT